MVVSPTPSERTRPVRRRRSPSELRWAWLFLVPAAAFYLFVVLVPSVRGGAYAFTDWDGLSSHSHFVGFANFTAMYHDHDARSATAQTLFYAVVVTIATTVIGVLLAVALTSRIRSRNYLRVLFFLPAVITPVVVSFLWRFLYDPQVGPINTILEHLGVAVGSVPAWLGDPSIAKWSVAAVVIWQNSGLAMIIFIAGLTGVPPELHDAGRVDGASTLQRFRHVTLPLLRPATTIVVALSLASCMKLFDQVWVLTMGGPAQSTETLTTALYQDAFTLGHFGDAMVLALVVTLLAVIASGVQ
jgi:raffinose/stachyose/melibiose transport system permease protein